jgi:hypothetical protein
MKPAHISLTLILFFALARTSQATAFHASPPYPLSAEDLAAVEVAACMKPFGLKLDRAVGKTFRTSRDAEALCVSHGTVDGQPLHYRASCDRQPEGWRCPITYEFLRVKFGSKHVYIVAPRSRMSEAFGATKYLVKVGKLDVQQGGISNDVSLNFRTIYHVSAEPAGERALRIQDGFRWLYVERDGAGGYREVPDAEAAALGADLEERRDARRPVYHYFYGHHTGDAAHFREEFLPTARIESVRDGKLVSWTLDEYCRLFDGKPADDEAWRVRSIEHSDVSGDTAIVKATLDHGATVLTDYFVLLKVDGKWKIANAVQNERKK